MDIVLFLSIFLFPWWIALIIGIIGVFLYGAYGEFIIAGFILDAIYFPVLGQTHAFPFFSAVLFFGVFCITYWIRTKIRY